MLRNAKDYLQINVVQDIYIYIHTQYKIYIYIYIHSTRYIYIHTQYIYTYTVHIYIYTYTVHIYIDKRRELLMNSTLTFVGVLKATSGADDRILEES